MLTRKTLLLAKSEATYGTAPTMTGADAVLISNLDISVDVEQLERDTYRDSISSRGTRAGRKTMEASFDVEFKGKSTVPSVADPVEWDNLIKACGMISSDITGGVIYKPTSDEDLMESVALKFNLDGMQYLMEGCYGNMTVSLPAGQFGVMSFTFSGLYNKPTDQSALTASYENDAEPPIVESLSFELDTWTDSCPETWNFDMGNEVTQRPCINAEEGLQGFRITQRKVSGDIDPEMVPIATYDPWVALEDGTELAISGTLGDTVGNQFDINKPTSQLNSITPGDRNGIRTYEMEYMAIGTDDEFTITTY